MRIVRMAVLSLLCAWTVSLSAQPMCGTSPENDARIRALHERARSRVGSLSDGPAVKAREGAFYVRNDETVTIGYRPFDLDGTSLVLTPSGSAAATVRREPLRYAEPAGEPLRDFQSVPQTAPGWHYLTYDLGFTLSAFGRQATRLYITAFNGIHLDPPAQPRALHYGAVAANVQTVFSPLMLTSARPSLLHYPRVWVDEREDAVIVTWRSATEPFAYDLQAEIRRDGSATYSYRQVQGLRWGTPVYSAGLDPLAVSRQKLAEQSDPAADVDLRVPAAIRPMVDMRKAEISRLRDSDLFAVTLTFAEPIDQSKLDEDDVLTFRVQMGEELASVEVTRDSIGFGAFAAPPDYPWPVAGAPGGRVEGNVIEVYGVQPSPLVAPGGVKMQMTSYVRGASNGQVERLDVGVDFPTPPRATLSDISAIANAASVSLPLAEQFALGEFDPFRVWEAIKNSYGLREIDYDAVAMYQSFYTDLITYAGAYSTGGNPQADGVAPSTSRYGTKAPRTASLLHMNQLTYAYNAKPQTASQVMLHELGHRWLYFLRIHENGQNTNSLNPLTAHPAAYVHTPSAFPVYGENESSTMGGAFFTAQPDGTYQAYVANYGYSWTDLYLMGLAAPEEVPPWFYIAGTNLPRQYWPQQGAIAKGERRNVTIDQVITALGPRNPGAATAPKQFRVLFVLVTEDEEPTAAEVAKVNEWRALLERDFALATGGRGSVSTTFTPPNKRRAARR